ncbi:MAG: hypothetical protein R3F13_17995 [Prosthecobacter sp.]
MPSLVRSTLHGAFGFAAVSVAAYSIWAFAPRLAGSEYGMYALIALVYLGGAGLALCELLRGEGRLGRFYKMFLPAFFGYALLWSLAWFVIKGRPGEWIGAAAGTLFFSTVCWLILKRPAGFWVGALVLFALHTAGYFVGGKWMYGLLDAGIAGWAKPQVAVVAKLGWGLFHGLGFGAGIGFALGWWQRRA